MSLTHEIKTRIVFKHFDKENHYFLVKNGEKSIWSLPTNVVGFKQDINDNVGNLLTSVSVLL